VNVTCPPDEIAAVADFYCDVLGLTRIEKPAGTEPSGAWFDVDGQTQVHVSARDVPAHPDAHFALVVDDLPALLARLDAGGHEWRPAPPVFGGSRGFTRDPAGNRIELFELGTARGSEATSG
jgi:catechol 2,3-dioxygenase-like lactoylglutathione lyase family enzyme